MGKQTTKTTNSKWFKSPQWTLLLIFGIFFLVLGVVTLSALFLPSHRTALDPAHIAELRL